MRGRYLVLGGFERSGHDSTASALEEAGSKRGLSVHLHQWRDVANLADHPMFTSHRLAASWGVPEIAGLLDEAWIATALHADLGHLLPVGFDGYLSVHPWSSMICAMTLQGRGDITTPLLDYHSEFARFPAVTHPRISAYLGGGSAGPLEPATRARCHRIGVAVPTRFHASLREEGREDVLVVSSGADGWAVQAMAPAARRLIAVLKPRHVVLLAPSEDARAAWKASQVEGEIEIGMTDISALLKASRWYLTKGGGTAVAEGLAAGCAGYVARSGVFWEDEAVATLSSRGIVGAVSESSVIAQHDSDAIAEEWRRTLGAADAAWALMESGHFVNPSNAEIRVLDRLIDGMTDVDPVLLPATTSRLRERLVEWRAQLSGAASADGMT